MFLKSFARTNHLFKFSYRNISHIEALRIMGFPDNTAGDELDKAELKKKYINLAKKYHPDNKGVGSKTKFQKLQEAYQKLQEDPEKKSEQNEGTQQQNYNDWRAERKKRDEQEKEQYEQYKKWKAQRFT